MLLLLYTLIIYFGASLASGLFLCAERLTAGQSLIKPKSHCTVCQHPLCWWQLLPLISYPLLRGHCYYCATPIPLAAWVSEIIGGFLGLFIWLTAAAPSFTGLLFAGLFLFSWIDVKQRILLPVLFWPWLITLLLLPHEPLHLTAMLLLVSGLGLFAYFSRGLGSGDVQLLAGIGLLYGFNSTIQILLFACLLAIGGHAFYQHKTIPFIPYLSLGIWLQQLLSFLH